jgi:hypothetical protein
LAQTNVPADPLDFGLTSFADILPKRDTIPGEEAGSFAVFQAQLMRTLTPFTPYEFVVAENLISIEWEILQHRKMRERCLRNLLGKEIEKELARIRGYDRGREGQEPPNLPIRALDPNPEIASKAHQELEEMGIDLLDLMGKSLSSGNYDLHFHELTLPQLETRRRQVRSDLDALQKARPITAEVVLE